MSTRYGGGDRPVVPAGIRRVLRDVASGRGIEGYVTFAVGTVFAVLDLVGHEDERTMLAVLLFAVSFLVFHVSAPRRSAVTPRAAMFADVLHDRKAFPFFPALLDGVRDLRVYGPTAINILSHAGEIERSVLSRGGTVRVVVQSFDPSQLRFTARQLDRGLDLEQTLRASQASLERLARTAGFDYRCLAFNPGFSLLVADPGTARGYVIVEVHGFADGAVNDRMHIRIAKADSPHWFDYWVAKFDAIWADAGPLPSWSAEAAPPDRVAPPPPAPSAPPHESTVSAHHQ